MIQNPISLKFWTLGPNTYPRTWMKTCTLNPTTLVFTNVWGFFDFVQNLWLKVFQIWEIQKYLTPNFWGLRFQELVVLVKEWAKEWWQFRASASYARPIWISQVTYLQYKWGKQIRKIGVMNLGIYFEVINSNI